MIFLFSSPVYTIYIGSLYGIVTWLLIEGVNGSRSDFFSSTNNYTSGAFIQRDPRKWNFVESNRANEQSGDSNRNVTPVEVGKIDLKPKLLIQNNRYTKVTSNETNVV